MHYTMHLLGLWACTYRHFGLCASSTRIAGANKIRIWKPVFPEAPLLEFVLKFVPEYVLEYVLEAPLPGRPSSRKHLFWRLSISMLVNASCIESRSLFLSNADKMVYI